MDEGTASALEKNIKDAGLQATIVSQPMFFTDGCAVEDFNWPDRLILGSTSSEAVQMLKQIFHPLVMRGVPVIVTNQATAELVREAATAFVATKISFINEVATLCERVNADAVNLALALGLDKKIAPRCLQPGAGMGGVFAESDMDALAELAQSHGVPLKVLSAARDRSSRGSPIRSWTSAASAKRRRASSRSSSLRCASPQSCAPAALPHA